MELLQFEITNAGTLGSRWTPPAPETKKASSLPGAALAALLQEEDDEDDWGGDAPDMSAEFARLSHLNEESDTDALPLGQGDRRYLRPRLLWENQTPTADFPAGRVPAEGKLFLIEAAPKADSGDTFWELGFPGGCLRAGDGAERTFAYEEGALRFGTTEKGDGWAVPRKIYALL